MTNESITISLSQFNQMCEEIEELRAYKKQQKEKTGHWYIRETYPLECESWECSECKEVVYEKTKFCPECGARMVSE